MNVKIKLDDELLKIDPKFYCEKIEDFIATSFKQSNCQGIIVPISGELDSSVVAFLCVRAIGKEKVYGLYLPERFGNPEANYYGKLIAQELGIKTYKKNISSILRGLGTSNIFISLLSGRENMKKFVNWSLKRKKHTALGLYLDTLNGQLDPSSRKLITRVNSIQRARLLAYYKIANENNFLLVGSSNRTEQTVGLFVKYGIDDAADIMPLRNLLRSHLLQIAEYIQIPNL